MLCVEDVAEVREQGREELPRCIVGLGSVTAEERFKASHLADIYIYTCDIS